MYWYIITMNNMVNICMDLDDNCSLHAEITAMEGGGGGVGALQLWPPGDSVNTIGNLPA